MTTKVKDHLLDQNKNISSSFINLDGDQKDDDDGDPEGGKEKSCKDVKIEMAGKEQMETYRLYRLYMFFIDSIKQTFIATLFTVLAIEWQLLRNCIINNPFSFQVIMWYSFITFHLLRYLAGKNIACMTGKFGNRIQALFLLVFLTFVYTLMAVDLPFHFPRFFPYWIVITTCCMAATFILLAFLTVKEKVKPTGFGLWLCSLIVPLFTLLGSQLVYLGLVGLEMLGISYEDYMLNICAAIVLAILFTAEDVVTFQTYVNSSEYEKQLAKVGLLPSSSFDDLTKNIEQV